MRVQIVKLFGPPIILQYDIRYQHGRHVDIPPILNRVRYTSFTFLLVMMILKI